MPPNIICFSRNRCTSVETIDDSTFRSSCQLQDTLTDAYVEIRVRLPELEITSARAEFRRTPEQQCLKVAEALDKMIGIRIGAGMLKIIKGLIGEATACKQLAFMVEECCHGVILSMTKDQLKAAPVGAEVPVAFYTEMVRQNIRLYNRCAAFAPGSRIVEGIEPPKRIPRTDGGDG
jgi:Protein of unknown function (DUF2889)